MHEGRRILAVVPARGGSKGIPLKNLRTIGGVSLVAMAGHVATAVAAIDRAVVSTDHEGIAAEAERAGLAAPFRRPEGLSGPTIADWDVLHHALLTMEARDGVTYDLVLMLQPTSPSRTAGHVMRCIAMLVDGGFDAVWSVSETDSKGHPLKQLTIGDGDALDYYDPAGAKIVARQQLKPVYHRNGIVYAFTRQCLVEQKTIKGAKTGALLISEPVSNIDTEMDLAWAEFLLSREGKS
ncbi:MAG: acylneuraminate cytidylyltransferase family protein [Alphaproteobacteria bacterium]|nr:acylneuraminate cytidylyltransferase family protein [Alphaproteobacteria bacterium]